MGVVWLCQERHVGPPGPVVGGCMRFWSALPADSTAHATISSQPKNVALLSWVAR